MLDMPLAMISAPRSHTLDAALSWLRAGGFRQHVTVMAEPGRALQGPADGVTVMENKERRGAFANWFGALDHLITQAESRSEKFVMLVEDDVIYRTDAAEKLEALLEKRDFYAATLYTSARCTKKGAAAVADLKKRPGWSQAPADGAYGALALCFSIAGARDLLEALPQPGVADPMTAPMDNLVYRYFNGWMWFHYPSLAWHENPAATTIPRAVNAPSPKNYRIRQAVE